MQEPHHPDRTPEQFDASLRDAVAWMDQYPEKTAAERIVLVCAWNEFGEGGHIAPTRGDPDGKYLKALKAVVDSKAIWTGNQVSAETGVER